MVDSQDFDTELLTKLQEAFETEAREQIENMMNQLVKLELCSDDTERRNALIEEIFRDLHSLKGSARAVNQIDVESMCHPLEGILSSLNHGELKVTSKLIDLVLDVAGTIRDLLDTPRRARPPLDQRCGSLIGSMKQFVNAAGGASMAQDEDPISVMTAEAKIELRSVAILPEKEPPRVQSAASSRQESLRISTSKLDGLMQQAEEMLSIKAMARQQSAEMQNLQSLFEEWVKSWSKTSQEIKSAASFIQRDRTEQTDRGLKKFLEVVEQNLDRAGKIQEHLNVLVRSSGHYSHATSTSVDVLLEETKRLLMMPANSLFEGFPLLCRDLARELGKEIEFTVEGGDIELDKRILTELKDPLVHLIRNTIDHGLETPEERKRVSKPPRGICRMKLEQVDGSTVELRVIDDGKGIDPEKIKATALKRGMLSAEELQRLTSDEILRLIFRPAFSTSENITTISGRGIGMSVVEETINRLGGRIRIETQVGEGTTFTITLPVTIATFRGVMMEVLDRVFVVPTTSIDRVVRVRDTDIKAIGGTETLLLDQCLIPVCRMDDALQLPFERTTHSDQFLTVGILGSGDNRVGFIVDEVLEEQEVLVKNLGSVLNGIKNVSGLTILGSGQVVPILNVQDLLKFSKKEPARARPDTNDLSIKASNKNGKRERKVLVVDDTLTARILLRNIVESSGFTVKTANDGNEAMDLLRDERFDLVITDIEMPGKNGFELTRAMRQDPKLCDLPVVMVTALSKKEDREEGVAAGVSAYFVKSDFNQSNLIEILETLI